MNLEIVLRRGIPLFNSGINSGELIFGIDIMEMECKFVPPEGLVEIDKYEKLKKLN